MQVQCIFNPIEILHLFIRGLPAQEFLKATSISSIDNLPHHLIHIATPPGQFSAISDW
jgi:hypothetical protein